MTDFLFLLKFLLALLFNLLLVYGEENNTIVTKTFLTPFRIPRPLGITNFFKFEQGSKNPSNYRPIPIEQLTRPFEPSDQVPNYSRDTNEDPAVSRFRNFLRMDTSHPNPNYNSTVKWLENQAKELGLEFDLVKFDPIGLKSFTIVMTWRGRNESLKSVMLNSHIDVVPADKSKWKYPPFDAYKDKNGDIYARGAQDRKSLGCQYLEAIRRLKPTKFKPLRTLHITFVPDEEVGGALGMQKLVKSSKFKQMNVGMELDEGTATPGDEYALFYGERTPRQFKVYAQGKPSHAALMFRDNAGEKLGKVINGFMKFRNEQIQKLEENSSLEAGDVTSINLSQLGGGLQANIVPSEMWAVFDMRVKLESNWTFVDVDNFINKTVSEAGDNVRYEYLLKSDIHGVSNLDENNVWWTTFRDLFDKQNLTLAPKFFPGATDARFIRNENITAFGFAPLPRTSPLQHQDNEFMNEKTFLDGIKMYELIIPALTSVQTTS